MSSGLLWVREVVFRSAGVWVVVWGVVMHGGGSGGKVREEEKGYKGVRREGIR